MVRKRNRNDRVSDGEKVLNQKLDAVDKLLVYKHDPSSAGRPEPNDQQKQKESV